MLEIILPICQLMVLVNLALIAITLLDAAFDRNERTASPRMNLRAEIRD